VREVHHQTQRVLVVVCDKGEEAIATIGRALTTEGVSSAQVTAVGGFSAGEVGYFDRDRHGYLPIPIGGQVEVLSLLSDVAERDGEPACTCIPCSAARTAAPSADTCSGARCGQRWKSSSPRWRRNWPNGWIPRPVWR
jgi:hypothetical protein